MGKWSISSVTSMSGAFAGARAFGQNLARWSVAAVNSTFGGVDNHNGAFDKVNMSDCAKRDVTLAGAWSNNAAFKVSEYMKAWQGYPSCEKFSPRHRLATAAERNHGRLPQLWRRQPTIHRENIVQDSAAGD